MRLTCEMLPPHLERGLARLYTIHGDEPLLALEAVDRISTAGREAGFTERELLSAEPGFAWAQLGVAARSLSLFAEKKILELRIVSGKPGTEGASALVDYCAELPEATLTIIVLPKVEKAAQAAKWFSTLEANGIVVTANAVPHERLPAWINERLAQQGQRADRDTLQFLADSVEGNLLAAFQEVKKLALLFPQGDLKFAGVKDAVLDVARYDVFKLTEAMLSADTARYARILTGLREEGEPPAFVLWALSEELRALGRINRGLAQGKSWPVLMRENRVWGSRQALVESMCRRVSQGDLEAALAHAAQIDRMIKGVERGDVWDAFLHLGLRLAVRTRRATRSSPSPS